VWSVFSKFQGEIWGIWLVSGSFFPLGQGLEGQKVSKEVELSWEKVRMGLGRLGGSNLLIATLTSTH
jgi:hypothetical protein